MSIIEKYSINIPTPTTPTTPTIINGFKVILKDENFWDAINIAYGRWSNEKKGSSWRRGLIKGATRIGIYGEKAFSLLFKTPIDRRYLPGGDKQDFILENLPNKTIEIKTAGRFPIFNSKHKPYKEEVVGLVIGEFPPKNENDPNSKPDLIDIDQDGKDIYVFAYLEYNEMNCLTLTEPKEYYKGKSIPKEHIINGEISVIIAGSIKKEQINKTLHEPRIQSYNNQLTHKNFEIPYQNLKPMQLSYNQYFQIK